MAPWAGRIAGACLQWEEEAVQLPQRLPPHALHGTVLDRPWRLIGPQSIEIDLGADWPWPGRAQSDFSVQGDTFEWSITVEGAEPMPVVVGWHPWFRRRIGSEDATLTFQAGAMYERAPNGIPTGRLVAPAQAPWDDCFTEMDQEPRLCWGDDLSLQMSSDCDHWVIYTEPEHGLCIEPQSGPPDAVNLERAFVVQPGQPLRASMTWQIQRT